VLKTTISRDSFARLRGSRGSGTLRSMTVSALPLGTKREQGAVIFIRAGLGGSLIFASPRPSRINDSPLKLDQGPLVSSVSIKIHSYRGIVSLNTRPGSRTRGSLATLNGSCVLLSRSCRDTPRQLLTCSPERFLYENTLMLDELWRQLQSAPFTRLKCSPRRAD
jgi:hypothetical protein